MAFFVGVSARAAEINAALASKGGAGGAKNASLLRQDRLGADRRREKSSTQKERRVFRSQGVLIGVFSRIRLSSGPIRLLTWRRRRCAECICIYMYTDAPLFEWFLSVCPEPVLVKTIILV